MMIELVLSPRDGLTLKDARGFSVAGGVTAGGLPWPGPATTAGAVRGVVGRLRGLSETYEDDDDDKKAWMKLLGEVTVCGPVIVSRPLDGEAWVPLWPRPEDAVRLPHPRAGRRREPDAELHWLEPRPRGTARWRARGLWSGDGEESAAIEDLWLPWPDQRKKPLTPRLLWSHEEFVDWLWEPRQRDEQPSPQPVERVDIHVRINEETLAAADEYLFAHSTYESLIRLRPERDRVHELGIALRIFGVGAEIDLTEPVWRLGGEARFATASRLAPEVLVPPEHLTRRWKDTQFLRLILATPARFDAGWRPDWLEPAASGGGFRFEGTLPGLGRPVVLRAAIMDRAAWISGWDLANRRPKPSSAYVPAGAVYFFESLVEPFTADDVAKLWLSTLQRPDDAAARDGFGLALPGAWPINV
jgi:CRISPR-associated protein Cmr3